MTPLTKYNTYSLSQSKYDHSPDDAFTAWSLQKGYQSAMRMRWPVVLASSRLQLGSRRCDELQGTIDDLRDRLLNASPIMPFEHRSDLEKRLVQAEASLHHERLTVWKDLLPLTRDLRDAALEDMRTGFLSELTRLIGESAEESPRP